MHPSEQILKTYQDRIVINKRAVKKRIKSTLQLLRRQTYHYDQAALMLLGTQMSWKVAEFPVNTDFRKVGFKVFSQWDEDGIIQYLISKIPIENRTFIEFGVENYEESNTRFLLFKDHWRGLVLDGCERDISYIQSEGFYPEFDLQARSTWITRENINGLLEDAGFGSDVGLLSIDIDGNEYWIWDAIESIRPRIVIVEYNSLFGLEPITIPYKADFADADSRLYFGASLSALNRVARTKGYSLLGSNVWGHNAFFVRTDLTGPFTGLDPEDAYIPCSVQTRISAGQPFSRGDERIKLIEHLPVLNVVTGEVAPIRDLWRPVDNPVIKKSLSHR